MYSINNTNIRSAIVSTLISAVLLGILAFGGYILGVGSFFKIETRALVDVVGLAILGSIMTGVTSLLKSYATDYSGRFLGKTTVVDK